MKIIITEKQAKKLHSKSITCDKCEHEWVVEDADKNPDLCHDCGWDNKKKEYNRSCLTKRITIIGRKSLIVSIWISSQ